MALSPEIMAALLKYRKEQKEKRKNETWEEEKARLLVEIAADNKKFWELREQKIQRMTPEEWEEEVQASIRKPPSPELLAQQLQERTRLREEEEKERKRCKEEKRKEWMKKQEEKRRERELRFRREQEEKEKQQQLLQEKEEKRQQRLQAKKEKRQQLLQEMEKRKKIQFWRQRQMFKRISAILSSPCVPPATPAELAAMEQRPQGALAAPSPSPSPSPPLPPSPPSSPSPPPSPPSSASLPRALMLPALAKSAKPTPAPSRRKLIRPSSMVKASSPAAFSPRTSTAASPPLPRAPTQAPSPAPTPAPAPVPRAAAPPLASSSPRGPAVAAPETTRTPAGAAPKTPRGRLVGGPSVPVSAPAPASAPAPTPGPVPGPAPARRTPAPAPRALRPRVPSPPPPSPAPSPLLARSSFAEEVSRGMVLYFAFVSLLVFDSAEHGGLVIKTVPAAKPRLRPRR